MRNEYRQYLRTGAARGAGFALALQYGNFNGGSGFRLGRRCGSSLEFMEHRDYAPGDDLRRLDWNVYARTERLTVKLYREEINPRLDLIVDGSASMALPGSAKAEAVLGLAAFLAAAAANAGYTVQSWQSRDQLEPVHNGSGDPGRWDHLTFDAASSPAEALSGFRGGFLHQGVRIVLSDLLWNGLPAHFLGKIGAGSAGVIVIQLLAAADLNPGVIGNVRLTDSETGVAEELFLDAPAVERYRSALARHRQQWSNACREAGVMMITMTAEELLAQWDVQPLLAREIIRAI
ncbi:MAG: DUF58 domain-containing protein [Victivallales bacterium]|nr:DUF58 domain-containing protein [Victivallales bacterium]